MQSSSLNTSVTRYTFKVGDMAVHPAHGVGEVERIEEKDFGGRLTACYVIRIRDTGLKVMVPPHIGVGTRIVILTEDGSYVERAKD